ncbi:MAG: acyltransferase [Casimicrobiaceae bacterium]
MQTLGDRATRSTNSFDFIRWLAASLVIVSHEYAVTGSPGAEPMLALSRGFTTMGAIGLDIFFVVSGFLVTRSLLERRSLRFFVAARAMRILPALAVVLALSAFVLGPLLSDLAPGEYLANAHTWSYITRNLGLRHQQLELPGVFSRNAIPNAVNGSLWSLWPEVQMYGWVLLLGAIAALRWRLGAAIVVGGMTIALAVAWRHHGDLTGTALEPGTLARLAPYFALGSVAWCLRRRLPFTAAIPTAVGVLAVATFHTPAFVPAFALALASAVLWFAYASLGPLARWGRYGDFSYGLYIFASPVQQALATLFPEWGILRHGGVAYALTLVCAIASWKLVEAPVLVLKRRLGARSPVRGPTDAACVPPQPRG